MNTAKTPAPIACHLHDHLEVACLYRYRVRIEMLDGTAVEGVARTTQTKEGREYLVITKDAETQPIPMASMSRLSVLTKPADFRHLDFLSATET